MQGSNPREDNWTRWILIIIGIGILAAVGLAGGIQSEAIWTLIVTVAFIFIILGILWNYRSKLSGLLIALLILFIMFFVTGLIAGAMGVKQPFTFGMVSIMLIVIFGVWVDGEKLARDYFKFIIFEVVIIIATISGFLPMMNDTMGKLFGFLKGM